MPKINIYPHPLPNQPDGADTRIEIGWSPNGGVQISTTKLRPGASPDQELIAGNADSEPAQPAWSGAVVDVTREQINAAIRGLREARDKAFGADE